MNVFKYQLYIRVKAYYYNKTTRIHRDCTRVIRIVHPVAKHYWMLGMAF